MVGRYLGEEAFLGSHEDGDYTHRRWSSCEEDSSFPVVPRRMVLFGRNESHLKSQAKYALVSSPVADTAPACTSPWPQGDGQLGDQWVAYGGRPRTIVQEPWRHLIDDGGESATEVVQAHQDAIDEVAQRRRQMRAGIPLERAPLAFLGIHLGFTWDSPGIHLGGVLGQPDHLQPVLPRSQGKRAQPAGLRRASIEPVSSHCRAPDRAPERSPAAPPGDARPAAPDSA